MKNYVKFIELCHSLFTVISFFLALTQKLMNFELRPFQIWIQRRPQHCCIPCRNSFDQFLLGFRWLKHLWNQQHSMPKVVQCYLAVFDSYVFLQPNHMPFAFKNGHFSPIIGRNIRSLRKTPRCLGFGDGSVMLSRNPCDLLRGVFLDISDLKSWSFTSPWDWYFFTYMNGWILYDKGR